MTSVTIASLDTILSLRQDAGRIFQNRTKWAEFKCSQFIIIDLVAYLQQYKHFFPHNNCQQDLRLLTIMMIQDHKGGADFLKSKCDGYPGLKPNPNIEMTLGFILDFLVYSFFEKID